MDKITYSDSYLSEILETVSTIAMVGVSPNIMRPSHFAMKYLKTKGYRIIPINPAIAGQQLMGEPVYASLHEVPHGFDMVDIFRNSLAAGKISNEAIELKQSKGIKVIWMQLGVRNQKAETRATKAGLKVVMDRCPKIEFGRLYGELSWSGVNSKIVSSKRPYLRKLN
ncbi:MAG: CoA-binding protein [Pseudomonadota bacterium]|nr:CoA-binding protein [Pseudomonadota bacterium]